MICYCLPCPGFAHQSCLRSLLSTWSSKNYNEDHLITLSLCTQTFPKLVSLSRSLKNCQSGYLKSTPLPQDTCNGAVHILRQPKWGVRSRAVAALRRQCEKKAEKAARRHLFFRSLFNLLEEIYPVRRHHLQSPEKRYCLIRVWAESTRQ